MKHSAGTEGVDYVIDEDGNWDWKGGMEAMTASTLSELSVYDTGDSPGSSPTRSMNAIMKKTCSTSIASCASWIPMW